MGLGSFSDSPLETTAGVYQILPCQYYDLSGGHRLTGEQRLMLALLADAINVYQKGALSRSTRKRLLYVDAERWIMGNHRNHVFSFETACDALGINPAVLRRRMVDWKHSVARNEQASDIPPHLRLKVTPRTQRLSQRQSGAAPRALRS